MTKLRCLSVHQPWAWAICAGLKRVENRRWTTKYRGPVCIHAAIADDRLAQFVEQVGEARVEPMARVTGAIIGVADLVDIVGMTEQLENDPSAVGPICWIFENGRLLDQPIACKGKTSLFYATEKDSADVEKSLAGSPAVHPTDASLIEALHGDWHGIYMDRAIEYWELQRYEEVVRCCTKAIEGQPGNAPDYRCRSMGLYQLARYPEALADVDRAIALEPTFAASYIIRSDIHEALENEAAADADWVRALELDPSIAESE